EGQRGLCFVRGRVADRIVLTSYGRSSGFCVDPVEKKPLNHFPPGTPVLSFGTAGCNLAGKFFQNWDISKSREIDTLADAASATAFAEAVEAVGCRSVAFTYNGTVALSDPIQVGSDNKPRRSAFEYMQTSANQVGSEAWMSAPCTPDRLMQQSPRLHL